MRNLFAIGALALLPTLWNPIWGQSPTVGVSDKQNSEQASKKGTAQAQGPAMGTVDKPIVVDTQGHKKNESESAADQKETERQRELERRTIIASEQNTSAAKWTACATWTLVFVGGIGSWFAWRTLRSIEKQTAALMEANRPHLVLEPHGNPYKMLRDKESPRIQITLANKGMSIAEELTYETWAEVVPAPFSDFTDSADRFGPSHPMRFSPNQDPMTINIPLRQGITDSEYASLNAGRMIACFRLRASYKDPFRPERSTIGFCYSIRINGLEPLPKYND